jgi:hypothetical protein
MATKNVKIAGRAFACVRLSEADFTDVAAVYVILCVGRNGRWTVLDVGQSGQVGSRIDDHDRKACWTKNCPNNNIWVCVYRMAFPQYTRQDRENFEAK